MYTYFTQEQAAECQKSSSLSVSSQFFCYSFVFEVFFGGQMLQTCRTIRAYNIITTRITFFTHRSNELIYQLARLHTMCCVYWRNRIGTELSFSMALTSHTASSPFHPFINRRYIFVCKKNILYIYHFNRSFKRHANARTQSIQISSDESIENY